MPRKTKLDAAPAAEHKQPALDGLEKCRVSFLGMAIEGIGAMPALGDVAKFMVTAACCVAPHETLLKAGDVRLITKFRVESVEIVEGPAKPDNGPDLFSGDDGNGE
ncbi:MAG: hypothetical protein JO296_21275 [Pseudonocardiales bacterium]|nr:hypothetical protein [Pseudonocardiales bacterium]